MTYHPQHKWLWRTGDFSVLVDKRATVLFLLLTAGLALTTAISLAFGSGRFDLAELLAALRGVDDGIASMILYDIRLPRTVAALSAGLALGLAGAISQAVFRNRLATPDVLGINEGATLAIVMFVLFTATAAWPFWIAPVGALCAVALLYAVCAARSEYGAVLLICGICLMEFLRAIVEFLMSLGALHEVQSIYVWLHGSFVGQDYGTALPILVTLAALLPVLTHVGRRLDYLRLPPAVTTSIGINMPMLRLASVTTITVLAALGASIGGPVAFVAMAAPILVAYAVKDRILALWSAGLVGAGLVLVCDTVARSLIATQEIPAGVVTRILGGMFLLYLLLKKGAR